MNFWSHFWQYAKQAKKLPQFKYFVFFLIIQIVYEQHGSTNVGSRLALLSSMSQRQSFNIQPYKENWTTDWAETSDGRVYSNKAPGPAFLAYPIYWVFDRLTIDFKKSELENRTKRNNLGHHFFRIVTFLFQIFPYYLIGLYFLNYFSLSQKFSKTDLNYWSLAYLFGTTATVFLNTYFGHGMATVFSLFLSIALLNRKWFWAGFFYGWALLSDYSLAVFLPPLLIYLFFTKSSDSFLKRSYYLGLGAIFPALLWIWYHTICFGSPLNLPTKFQNPKYLDLADQTQNLWGALSLFPKYEIVKKLLMGTERGLLFSQPWVLILFVYLAAAKGRFKIDSNSFPHLKGILGWGLSCFISVFIMNASFGGWHGGASAGPRYLTAALPILTLFLPFVFFKFQEQQWKFINLLLKMTIFLTTILFGLILSSGVTTPEHGTLWGDLLKPIISPKSPTAALRFGVFILSFCYLFLKSEKLKREAI